jgi:MoaA/NifB/PqqE/SkfB family radical SAM enzyme
MNNINNKNDYLAGSPYYLENVLGINLYERAKQGLLTYLLLNQPPFCDCHCRRCFMPDSRRDKCVNGLSLQEYCQVIQDAAKAGMICLEISGEGEPLMSDNLKGVIQCAYDSGFTTTLITNGHALSKNFIEYIFNRNVTLVASLFSLKQTLYEMDNNLPGSFETTLANIKTAANIFRNGIKISNGKTIYRIAIHTTAQVDNFDDLKHIRSFCDEHSIFFSIAPLASVGGGSEISKLKLTAIEETALMNLGHNSIILSNTSKYEIGREVCGTCLYGLNIGYDGNLLFDAHAGYEIGSILGNIRENSIEELIRQQRKIAPLLFNSIKGFCPVRDPLWPKFLSNIINDNNNRSYVF